MMYLRLCSWYGVSDLTVHKEKEARGEARVVLDGGGVQLVLTVGRLIEAGARCTFQGRLGHLEKYFMARFCFLRN